MSRKVVGITCGITEATETSGPRHVLNDAYVRAIEEAGGIPIVLPSLSLPSPETWMGYLDAIDGLLLTGGADIDPTFYGQPRHEKLGEVQPVRDATEIPLVQKAIERDLPIFGICRGIQTLNVALGGTLYQDLPSEFPSEIHHRQTDLGYRRSDFSHSITIEPDSRLAAIVGCTEMPVNSLHHQAVRDVAPGLRVVARAPDGVIEGLESDRHHFILAVQFHPEETAVHDPRSKRLFEAFLAAL
ncbi:gamma-glutamyl-gamma-aminobutyrate hydrolase family protein [Chthonomonas calidirosea]|uniref:gamma-glutamyl-gamma-aminobutyrate hydrolase family protein n=1 Tax=Chthonomonas calidirosea TaxID=454171 RepID=UPI0006EC8937|nr:gamma-glutamyl-gamma-aminobutyrate hydrolase family protein [Chthonomonas calidirosea]CEK18953.1 predicted glutamine amidotransferase [Chthonomonas calidirosea]